MTDTCMGGYTREEPFPFQRIAGSGGCGLGNSADYADVNTPLRVRRLTLSHAHVNCIEKRREQSLCPFQDERKGAESRVNRLDRNENCASRRSLRLGQSAGRRPYFRGIRRLRAPTAGLRRRERLPSPNQTATDSTNPE